MNERRVVAATDSDFLMGQGCPQDHPKKQQLNQLIEENAPEYARAPQSTGFYSIQDGRFIRSRTDIITSVINELMPHHEGGRYMGKNKNTGAWVVRVGFDCYTKQVRNVVQERFNKLIKAWNRKLPPLPPLLRSQPPQPHPPQEEVDDQKEEENSQRNDGAGDRTNETARCTVEPPVKNTAGDTGNNVQEHGANNPMEDDAPLSNSRSKKIAPNVFLACGGATTWNELLTIPILADELRLTDVARSFAYFCEDRRIVCNTKGKSGSKISLYKCQSCTWTVKFVKRRGAETRGDPWYLDTWGTSDSASSSKHDAGCYPVEVLRQGEILRNSLQLREYLSEHREANRDEIEAFMMTKNIDVSQMGKGSFYDARNNILSLLEMNDVDFSSVINGGRSATSSEIVRQILGVGGDSQEAPARDEATSGPCEPVRAEAIVGGKHALHAHSNTHPKATKQAHSQASSVARDLKPDNTVSAHCSEHIKDNNTMEAESYTFGRGCKLAPVDENSPTTTEGNEEGTTPSFGSSLHLSRGRASAKYSTSTPASEALRQLSSGLPDSDSAVLSSLTPSEKYLRSLLSSNDTTTTGKCIDSSIGTFDASNTTSELKRTSDTPDEHDHAEAGETRNRSQKRALNLTEPPAKKVRSTPFNQADFPRFTAGDEEATDQGLTSHSIAPNASMATATAFDCFSLLDDQTSFNIDDQAVDTTRERADVSPPDRIFHGRRKTKEAVSFATSTSTESSVALTNLEIVVKHDRMSAGTGLGNVGGIPTERMLTALTDRMLNVNETKRLLDELSDRSINGDKQLKEIGKLSRAIRVVLAVLKNHINDKSVLLKTIKFAIQLYGNHDSIQVSRDFVVQTMRVLQLHRNDANLLFHGWWLLGLTIMCDSHSQDAIARLDGSGIDLILKGMRQHSNAAHIQEEGCRLLGALAHENFVNQHKIAAAGGIDAVIQIMRHHEQHAMIQEFGCYVLGCLAYDSLTTQLRIAALGGIGVIFQAMRRHKQLAEVQYSGCEALAHLAWDNPENQLIIANANGTNVILQTLRRHTQHKSVQVWGCHALAALVQVHQSNYRALEEANGLDAFRQAMKHMPASQIKKYTLMMDSNSASDLACLIRLDNHNIYNSDWSDEPWCHTT